MLTSNTVNSSDSSKNVSKSYTYDNMGRITQTVSNGLTKTCIYDSLGRIYTESEYDNNGYSVFRGYFYEGISQYLREELTGQYHLLMYSDKTYEYDDEMRVIKVKESGSETVSYTYDANGNKKTETLANGVVSTYTYNNANRITKIENKSGNTDISSYEYSYYLDGSDACKVRNENGIIETTEYEYDGLKRLTEESVAVGSNTTDTYTYEYDDYGNRSKMTASGTENHTTVYSYSDSNGNYTALLQKETKTVESEENPLDLTSSVKQTVYTYDANGNQITKTAEGKTETNTYDGLNQLICFTDGETTASYAYNVSGLRYEKTVNGQTINHVWDGSQQVVADIVDSQFYEANCYIRGTNLVAKYNFCNGAKSEYIYYTQNAHGDVVNLTDADGEVVKSYTYDAFGVEKNIDDSDTNAFRYCGEYYDKETATVYLRARYYQASIGRFITRDSYSGEIGDPLSLNLYTYCHNNPIYYMDSKGTSVQVVYYHGDGNPWYGHVEIAVNDIIYTYGNYQEHDFSGPGNLIKIQKDDYLMDISRGYAGNEGKQFSIYTLDLSKEEENGILNFYESLISSGKVSDYQGEDRGYEKTYYDIPGKYAKYGVLSTNCVTTVRESILSSVNAKGLQQSSMPVFIKSAYQSYKDYSPAGFIKSLEDATVNNNSLVSDVQLYKQSEYYPIYGPSELSSKFKVSFKKEY